MTNMGVTDLPPGEILVVDDTPANLKLLSALLGEQGYQVRPAASGALALRSAAAKAPDLILLDVRMPELDGFEVCRRLKADPRTQAVPVIFISALSETLDKVTGFSLGAVDYIIKPFEQGEVLARVRNQIAAKRLRQQLEQAHAVLEARVAERTADLERTKAALQAKEERLRMAIEAAAEGVWDWAVQRDEMYLSEGWYQMLDYAPGAFPATSGNWRRHIHPEDLPLVEEALQAHLANQTPAYAAEFRMLTRSGDWKWILARGKVIERDEHGLALRMVGTDGDISQHKAAEARIQAALQEKEALAREIHHRVRDALQLVGRLLALQGRAVADGWVRKLFDECADRVCSMALVHEQLYRSEDLASIPFDTYLKQLLDQLGHQYSLDQIRIEHQLQPVILDLETAISCGLIVNELVTNAIKHGCGGSRAGHLQVELCRADGDQIAIRVADHGTGLPKDFSPGQATGLGWRLMVALAKQIGGNFRVHSNGGAEVLLSFPAASTGA